VKPSAQHPNLLATFDYSSADNDADGERPEEQPAGQIADQKKRQIRRQRVRIGGIKRHKLQAIATCMEYLLQVADRQVRLHPWLYSEIVVRHKGRWMWRDLTGRAGREKDIRPVDIGREQPNDRQTMRGSRAR
jgi:hypothetical protein